jgi:hypothetical protein
MTNPISHNNIIPPFLPAFYSIPEEEDRRLEWLSSTFSEVSDCVNDKKIGAYTQSAESFNGEKWIFDSTRKLRNGYQTILRIPSFVSGTYPLPIGNINPQFIITHVWGSASLPCSAVGAGDGRYFSFFGEGNTDIQFTMSDTQIVLTASGPMVNYSGFIVIEYLRDGF